MSTLPKFSILLIALLVGCGPDDTPRYSSGYVCTCEQRELVRQYVADANLSAMGGSDPNDYVNAIFATAVVTICDHRDSVLTIRSGRTRIDPDAKPCESWYDDFRSIHP